MSNKMKCYVCFIDGSPGAIIAKVFWYRKDAEQWLKDNEQFGHYKEMEIE